MTIKQGFKDYILDLECYFIPVDQQYFPSAAATLLSDLALHIVLAKQVSRKQRGM